VEVSFWVLVTVNMKSESVSSIQILGPCHIAGKHVERIVFDIHLSPFNSVELFALVLIIVNITSESVSSA